MFFGSLNRPFILPKQICRQQNNIKKIFEVLKTEKNKTKTPKLIYLSVEENFQSAK